MSRKFDIVLEGIDGLNQKMERYRDEANERFERVEAAIRFTSVDLREKIGKVEERLTGVEDKLDAVADDVGDPGRENARRDEVQGEVLSAGQDHRMAGIVAALVPHNPLHTATE